MIAPARANAVHKALTTNERLRTFANEKELLIALLEQRHDKFDDRALRTLKEILPTQEEARLFNRENTAGVGPAAETQAQANAQVWFRLAASRRLTLLDAVNALLYVQQLNRESNKLETDMQILQDCCNEICSSVALRELMRLIFRTVCAGDVTVGPGPGPASASLNVLKQLAMVMNSTSGDATGAAVQHLQGAATLLKGNYLAFRQDGGDAASAALPALTQLARLLRRPQQQQQLQNEGQAQHNRISPEHAIATELRRLQLLWAGHRGAFQYGGGTTSRRARVMQRDPSGRRSPVQAPTSPRDRRGGGDMGLCGPEDLQMSRRSSGRATERRGPHRLDEEPTCHRDIVNRLDALENKFHNVSEVVEKMLVYFGASPSTPSIEILEPLKDVVDGFHREVEQRFGLQQMGSPRGAPASGSHAGNNPAKAAVPRKDYTFRPHRAQATLQRRNLQAQAQQIAAGTLRKAQGRHTQATSAVFKTLVRTPAQTDVNEWHCVHTTDFFNDLSMLYGILTDLCTPLTCRTMSAGAKWTYLWADGIVHKRPIRVCARDYMQYMMVWIENQLDDTNVFPTSPPFPSDFKRTLEKIYTRMFRGYAHMFHSHIDDFEAVSAVPHLEFCFKYFVSYARQHRLVKESEQQPLRVIITALLGEDDQHADAFPDISVTTPSPPRQEGDQTPSTVECPPLQRQSTVEHTPEGSSGSHYHQGAEHETGSTNLVSSVPLDEKKEGTDEDAVVRTPSALKPASVGNNEAEDSTATPPLAPHKDAHSRESGSGRSGDGDGIDGTGDADGRVSANDDSGAKLSEAVMHCVQVRVDMPSMQAGEHAMFYPIRVHMSRERGMPGTKWIVRRRYKQFFKLRWQLSKHGKHSSSPNELAALRFPPRKWFKLDEQALSVRKEALNHFLQRVTQCDSLSPGAQHALFEFLDVAGHHDHHALQQPR